MTTLTRMRLLGPLLLALSLGAQAATFEVNSPGDEPDANPGNGTCATAGGQCTLRAAIQEANANAGTAPHRVRFAESVSAITLTASLPQIDVPLEINGNRADLANPRVDINGNGVSGGFQFNDSASQPFDPSPPMGMPNSGLFNLVVRNFNGNGVTLSGRGFTVQNCYIGTLPSGQAASANQDHGIAVSSPLPANPLPDLPGLGDLDLGNIEAVIAFLVSTLAALNAPTTIDGNLISGNGLDGVRIFGQHTAMVFVRGNRIGVSADGDLNIPNGSRAQGHGVQVLSSAFANFIGPFNLISGNNRPNSAANGVYLNTGAVRFPNFVAGNLIGPGGSIDPFNFDPGNPNVGDVLDFGNLENGIRLDTRRATTTPANPTPYSAVIGPANVISFNGTQTPPIDNLNADPNAGVLVTGNSADAYLFGNVIGGLLFDVGGNPQMLGGNKGDGIHVTTASHQIGGTSLFERNTISGNGRNGITVRGSSTREVRVQGNLIGRDFLNLLDFGQGGDGIRIDMANMLTIGGTEDGAGNVIAASHRNGIKLTNSSAWSNLISRNSLFGNATGGTGIGIDLDRTVNAPDATTAPPVPGNISNRGQAAPVICTGAMADPPGCLGAMPPAFDTGSNQVTLTAVLNGQPNTDYLIESFLVDSPGNLGNGEGRLFMASQTVSSDGTGLAVIATAANAPVGGGSGSSVTLTATDIGTVTRPDGSSGPANNTSEFSAAVLLVTPGTVAFDPSALAFGTIDVGSHADLVTLLGHTSGDAVTGIELSVTGAGFSVQGSTCGAAPFDLGPGESCEVSVRFAPAGAGATSGTLVASATTGTGDSVSLTGTGQLPGSLAFADSSLALGNVIVGADGTATTTLSNPGGAPVTDVQIAVTGAGFTRQGGTCDTAPFTLGAAASCTVTVRFQPAAGGPAIGLLSAVGSGASASVDLSGNGLLPAALAFDQGSYDFGTVTVGGQADRTAVLGNPGDVDAGNVQVNLAGTGFSRTGGTCGMAAFTLPAGTDCTVEMRFQPASPGAANGNLAASANGGLAAGASLTGTGLAAGALAFDPAALVFGNVPVGDSAQLTTTLANTGGTAIPGIEVAVTGGGFSRAGGDCPGSAFALAGGASCTVTIRFEPASGGAANGNLVATSPDGGASASLSGNGLAAGTLAFDPALLAFGDVAVGGSATLLTTLRNSGGTPVETVQVAISGTGFVRDGGTCATGAFSLAAGAECTVVVRFEPAAAGSAMGMVNATAPSATASASLTGNGLGAAQLAWNQASYAFGDVTVGAFAELTATLSNAGGQTASSVQVNLTGLGFSRTGGSCGMAPFPLPAGGNCTVVLRFAPTAAGAASGDLGASADGGLVAQASLGGTGLAAGALAFDPAALAFGDVPIGSNASLATTLSNGGGSSINGITLTVTGSGFSRTGGTCASVAFSLAAGASCTVIVAYGPTAAGAANGLLTASSASGGASASLSGNGMPPPGGAVGFTPPGGLNFGAIAVGNSASQSITLTNIGGAALSGLLVTVEGPFTVTASTCPASLAPAATCAVTVRFQPAVPGAATGLVRVVASGGINATAPLTGTGTAGQGPATVAVPGLGPFGMLVLLLALGLAGGWRLRSQS